MAITKIITPDLIDLPFNNTDGIVLAKGTTGVTAVIDYLVIAGGGGGGSCGGGGGAGGYRNSFNNESSGGGGSSETNLIASIGIALDIKVGAGGAGSTSQGGGVPGVNGTNSTFSTIVSTGGGGGGSNPSNDGEDGGSGGGTPSAGNSGKVGGDGELNQGFNGGNPTAGTRGPGYGGGGGGGAGGLGGDGTNTNGGAGGIGLESNITNTQTFRAGGGGAGAQDSGVAGSGGSGIGGNGTSNTTTGGTGTINTGSGGGGGGYNSGYGSGGAGSSGIIILRMTSNTTATFTSGVTFNLNNTAVAGQNIYTITATTSGQTVTFSATGDGTGRPSTAVDGEFRYNTTTKKVEFYDGADWFALTSSAAIQSGTTGACNYPTTASALYQLNDTPNDTCGTYTGVWSGTATYATGKFGKAADFNSSRYITTNVSFDGSTATGSSISFWFNTTNTSLQALIGSATQNGSSYYSTIYLGNATSTFPDESISFWNYDSGGTSVFLAKGGSTTYQDGEWHNCVMVSTSSSKAIYIDGISQTVYYTSSGSVSANANLTNITLAKGDSSSTFTGLIDQVRIFPSALTATQASALYTETAP